MANVAVDLGVTEENTFSLAGKQLKLDTKEDIQPYVEEIKNQKTVRKLNLSGNTIGVGASEALISAILHHKSTLVDVDFSDLYTGRLNTEIPQSLSHILPALLECENLKLVNFSDNAFGLQTIDPIESYLSKAISIEHLILSNNGMGPYAGARIGKSLFFLAKEKEMFNKPSLKTFICGRNRLENGSVGYLSIGLKNHLNLKIVRLYQNGIRPAGIIKLLKYGLSRNSELQVMDLQDNTFTSRASSILAELLPKWKKLVEINVNDCLLKSEGSLKFCKALGADEVRESFTSLKLQYNELEAPSLDILYEAIRDKMPNLKVLELNGNRFDEDAFSLQRINDIFEKRGYGEIDELDDLEEIDSSEESEEEDEEEEEKSELEEDSDIEQMEQDLLDSIGRDQRVDAMAEELAKTHIK